MPKIKLFNRIAAIVVRDGFVLTHQCPDDDGVPYQALPGGKLEPDETAGECLVREFREELDAELVVDHLLYVAEGFFMENGKHKHEVVLYFVAHFADPGVDVRSREDKIEARWLRLHDELDRMFPAWLREELPRRVREGWDAPVRYMLARDTD